MMCVACYLRTIEPPMDEKALAYHPVVTDKGTMVWVRAIEFEAADLNDALGIGGTRSSLDDSYMNVHPLADPA